MSDDIPIGQWEILRGRLDKKTDEEMPHCSSAFNNLPSPNERISGEAEQNTGEHAQGTLLGHMTDWDKYLPQVVGAYNSTQHSSTGISPFMMLTGRERAMPLAFFYPEYEGKKTSPQAYVKEAVRRQQEVNELCRRNTAQAQMRQRKKYDGKNFRRNRMLWDNTSGCSRIS